MPPAFRLPLTSTVGVRLLADPLEQILEWSLDLNVIAFQRVDVLTASDLLIVPFFVFNPLTH